MKTLYKKMENLSWHVIDANGRSLGSVAARIAGLLRGKERATFVPYLHQGDCVIVLNARKVYLSGKKMDNKFYYSHSSYPGGLRKRSYKEMLLRSPDFPLRVSVRGMLPKGPFGSKLMQFLKIYEGDEHPHKSQNPSQYVW